MVDSYYIIHIVLCQYKKPQNIVVLVLNINFIAQHMNKTYKIATSNIIYLILCQVKRKAQDFVFFTLCTKLQKNTVKFGCKIKEQGAYKKHLSVKER